MLITEEFLMIEGKGVDAEQAPNFTHLLLASNDSWVIPAGTDERRYFVLDVGIGKQQDRSYFDAIQREMDNGGYAALLHLLHSRDLTDFDVSKFPKTEALADQKLLSADPFEQTWLNILIDGVTPDERGWKNHPEEISVEGFQDQMELERRDRTRSIQTQLGLFIKKYAVRDRSGKPVTTRVNRNVWIVNGKVGGIAAADIPRNAVVRSMRRTLYRLRPLAELRAICPVPVDGWPDGKAEWSFGIGDDGSDRAGFGLNDSIPY